MWASYQIMKILFDIRIIYRINEDDTSIIFMYIVEVTWLFALLK